MLPALCTGKHANTFYLTPNAYPFRAKRIYLTYPDIVLPKVVGTGGKQGGRNMF